MSEKKYVLVEFPYPSGEGLHLGHAFAFTGGDVYARYWRMKGCDVLFPMGWDAFGLPTENHAIATGRKPHEVTRRNTREFERQMRQLGFSFDWERKVDTTDPGYYRFTQWIFLKLYERGLAYKAEMPINWCPSCRVGLANEEVVDGTCERCGAETTRRRISQWVVKITEYADRLISGLERTEFVDHVKAAQIHWIGRSEGARIRFPVEGAQPIEVFTTRPDTLWGATFLILAPEHPLVQDLIGPNDGSDERDEGSAPAATLEAESGRTEPTTERETPIDTEAIRRYVETARRKSDLERTALATEKTGVFSGLSAVNPATGERIPVYVSDFVLATYGTGAIMSVPAHDSRDHEFACRFNLPIVPVIDPGEAWDFQSRPYEETVGAMVSWVPTAGLSPSDAIQASIEWIREHGIGEEAVSYHLRDWIFSRQHYWGEPIPMVQCETCGWVPVPETALPVVLPDVEGYEPTDTGESPLASVRDWVRTECPKCRRPARRETDTMPNWAGSDWYFLRYCDPHNPDRLADMEKLRYWLPVDVYIGGDEHNTLHLLYSRFIYLFLHDLGVVPEEYPEPYLVRISHGVILAPDGRRMSKSRGNVIVPDEYVEKYGADTLRTYLMFMGPFDATIAWNDRAVRGVHRFLERFGRLVDAAIAEGHRAEGTVPADGLASPAGRDAGAAASEVAARDRGDDERKRRRAAGAAETEGTARLAVNKAVGKVTADIEAFRYNTAIAALMKLVNELWDLLAQGETIPTPRLRDAICLLAPFAPFTAQACLRSIRTVAGESGEYPETINAMRWPVFDSTLDAKGSVTIPVQVNGTLRGTIEVDPQTAEETIEQLARSAGTVEKHIGNKKVRRVIHVPGKAINFVV